MSVDRFLDTNILIYAYDLREPTKQPIAQGLVEAGWTHLGQTAISVQVLQELHVNLGRLGMPQSEILKIIGDFSLWPVVESTMELFRAALDEHQRWQLSIWDAMILAAARASRSSLLITEDFNHGQDYGGVVVKNPLL